MKEGIGIKNKKFKTCKLLEAAEKLNIEKERTISILNLLLEKNVIIL